jgi:Holliday junction resolvase RusA-like endonuclease
MTIQENIDSLGISGDDYQAQSPISFTVPGVPVAQPRQRHRVVTSGGRTFAQNYTPAKDPVNTFKAAVRMAAAAAYQGPPLAGPLSVSLTFVMPRPGRLIWKKREMPRVWAPVKPDRDNLEKSLQDTLNGQLWIDDSQIVAGEVRKVYAAGDEQACVEVRVSVLRAGA